MRVKMIATITGTRDGQEWPARGGELVVSDLEGADLVAAGLAEAVSEAASAKPARKQERATARPAEKRKG